MRLLWPIRVASKFIFFSFNLRLLCFYHSTKITMKNTWCHFCVQQVAFSVLNIYLGWFMVIGVRSCFLSSLLFWWWSSWSCLPRDFLWWPQHLEGVEHRCFTIIWGKLVRSWHDDGLSDCAFLESSMFRTSKSTIFRQGIRKYTWQILWFGSILPKGCSKLLVTFAWLHHLDVHRRKFK